MDHIKKIALLKYMRLTKQKWTHDKFGCDASDHRGNATIRGDLIYHCVGSTHEQGYDLCQTCFNNFNDN